MKGYSKLDQTFRADFNELHFISIALKPIGKAKFFFGRARTDVVLENLWYDINRHRIVWIDSKSRLCSYRAQRTICT